MIWVHTIPMLYRSRRSCSFMRNHDVNNAFCSFAYASDFGIITVVALLLLVRADFITKADIQNTFPSKLTVACLLINEL